MTRSDGVATTWRVRLGRQDERALRMLVERRHPRLDGAMRRITRLGDPVFVVACAVALLWAPFESMRARGRVAAIALIVSHVLVQLLKRTVSRERPELPVGVGSLVRAPDRFSFPSGHAAAALSLAIAVAPLLDVVMGTTVLALGVAVGISRCYLGVHYPGDVLAGWALAITGALTATLL
jgi:undecaprenyl-diphosphatase